MKRKKTKAVAKPAPPPPITPQKLRTIFDIPADLPAVSVMSEVPGQWKVGALPPTLPPITTLKSALLTPEQQATADAGEYATALRARNPSVDQVLGSLVTFRRAYSVAYRELQNILEEDAQSGLQVPELLCDLLAQFAMMAAAQPFNEHDVMQSLVSATLPWLTATINRHVDRDVEAVKAEKTEAEAARRARKIPLPYPHSPIGECSELERERSLVIAGWNPAVRWLLETMPPHQTAFNIIHLTASDKDVGVIPNYARFPLKTWKGFATSDLKLDQFVAEYVHPTSRGAIDLVICDDLAEAYASGYVGRPPGARAGDAHRRLRRWCDKLGAGLIGGVLLPSTSLESVPTPEYEQLKTFSYLRGLRVEPVGLEAYRCTLGDHAAIFEVSRETLSRYHTSTLLVPTEILS